MRGRLETMSEAADVDLIAHGTTSDAETIKDTAVAQPLIVAAGLATLPAVVDAAADAEPDSGPGFGPATVGAGHSVGEITAAAAAGVITPAEAVSFVALRGRGMAAASAQQPTGMSAVLGGDPDDVLDLLQTLGLTPANRNGGGQVVAAGTQEQLSALQQAPPEKARVIPLQVAGAFHTAYMQPAIAPLADYAATLTPADPQVTLLSNKDGAAVRDGQQVLDRLVSQVSSPVLWDATMQTMLDLGVTGLIELAPAGALVGLAKRGMRGVQTVAVKTPDDLEKAHALIAEHAHSDAATPQEA